MNAIIQRTRTRSASGKRQQGASLFVTVLVLTIVSFLAISGMRNSERASKSSARSRSTTRAIAAADSGLQVALTHLAQTPPDLTSIDINLLDGASVQSRTRTDVGAQDLDQVGAARDKEGYDMGMGAGVASVNRVYLVNTTATAGGSTVELQAKVGRSEVEGVGY